MIHYIIQVILFQLLFLVVYNLFLKRETFFNHNRAYLLITTAVSFLIPFFKIDFIKDRIPEQFRVQLPTIFIGDAAPETTSTTAMVLEDVVVAQQGVSVETILMGVYILGMAVAALFFVLKLRKLYVLKKRAVLQKFETHTLAIIPNSDVAFTFLKTIFLGANLSEPQKTHIVKHEMVHVSQRHSLDLLFFEVLRIACWCNPLIYVFQKKMQALQEFTADRIVASENKNEYYQNLLSEVFGTTKISFINTFYKSSLIKNRIVMLQKTNSNRLVQLKYLLVIPLLACMLVYTSCSDEKPNEFTEEANLKLQTDSEVMQKITELSEAIMKKGNITDEEARALKFLAMEAKEGDKIYTSVQEYIDDTQKSSLSMKDLTKLPIYPGCSGDNETLKKCLANGIAKFVMENFNKDLANTKELSGRQRIVINFEINKNGTIAHPKAKAPHPALEEEALRVVKLLPKMIPGEHKGKQVGVQYTLPIIFEINE